MVRIMTIVAALVATLLGVAPTAAAQSQYAYFQNSIDAFAAESGLTPINWAYVGPGGTVDTDCGLIPSDQALAFCMDDGVAYIGDDAAAWAAQFHPLAPAIAMAHESGHGFQLAAANGSPVPAIQATEDGADCVAGAWLFWANQRGYVTVTVFDLPGLYNLVHAIKKQDEYDIHGTIIDRGVAMIDGWTRGLDYCGTRYMPIR